MATIGSGDTKINKNLPLFLTKTLGTLGTEGNPIHPDKQGVQKPAVLTLSGEQLVWLMPGSERELGDAWASCARNRRALGAPASCA